jgi:hypothetical protein
MQFPPQSRSAIGHGQRGPEEKKGEMKRREGDF